MSMWTRNGAFHAENVRYWEWVNSRDEQVRESHQINEVVEVGKAFSNGLRYPLEEGGAAGDVINCRCVAVMADDPNE